MSMLENPFSSRFAGIRDRLFDSPNLRKVSINILWLAADKFLRMGVGLFVGVWIARYLGPEQFGVLNYSIAFVAIVGAFATFGLDSLVVRDIVKYPDKTSELLGSAFTLRVIGGFGTILISAIAILSIRSGDVQMFWLVLACSGGVLIQSFDVIDLYFQAKVLSKYTVLAKNAAFALSTIARIVLLVEKGSIYSFAIVSVVEIIIGAIFMLFLYRKTNKNAPKWHPQVQTIKRLLHESWPLILSSVASILNMRIGQVLLGGMMNDAIVGNYSAAVRISEIWLMVPGMLGSSIFPTIIALKEKSQSLYLRRLRQIFVFMSIIVIPFALIVSLSANWFTHLLYGNKYDGAGTYLSIHIWSGVPYLTTFAFSQMFYIERLTKIVFYVSVLSPVLTLGCSILLIPRYGGVGAAISTLISASGCSILSLTILNLKTRVLWGKPQ